MYDIEKRRSASVAFFVVMGYSCRIDNQTEAVSVDECFSSCLLSFLISTGVSSATVNSAESNALNINRSVNQSMVYTSNDWKYFSIFYSAMASFVELNR
jgi:hypothetical protein